jgi:hypothetical protein
MSWQQTQIQKSAQTDKALMTKKIVYITFASAVKTRANTNIFQFRAFPARKIIA